MIHLEFGYSDVEIPRSDNYARIYNALRAVALPLEVPFSRSNLSIDQIWYWWQNRFEWTFFSLKGPYKLIRTDRQVTVLLKWWRSWFGNIVCHSPSFIKPEDNAALSVNPDFSCWIFGRCLSKIRTDWTTWPHRYRHFITAHGRNSNTGLRKNPLTWAIQPLRV